MAFRRSFLSHRRGFLYLADDESTDSAMTRARARARAR
jgi:hypothetical protein